MTQVAGEFREGVVVRKPYERLLSEEIRVLDAASTTILERTGILCFNEEAAGIFSDHKCDVQRHDERSYKVKIPARVLKDAISAAPARVKLGARNPENSLLLDSEVPRIYFGSGSETNIWLDAGIETFQSEKDHGIKKRLPVFTERRGTVERLSTAARLAEELENLDFFIRPVNIQDEDINEDNHDVNKFYASLANTTKHVQAGLTSLEQLDNVLHLAETIAGGKEALRENPVISFITCTVKSPLQMVDDATQKLIEVVKRGMPIVISSSPQGGSTAPIQEGGMVAQINAEILSGIALSQMVRPGAPVIYGSVPVRARMDNLHDMYGAPEFNQYNIDCIQMARHYRVPCYSTAGVGDSSVPGMQATMEKFFTHLPIAMSGAQYIHYAFGLLERTNIFCPVQAVLDDQHIGMIKMFLSAPRLGEDEIEGAIQQIGKVMDSKQKLFVRFVRKSLRQGLVYSHYPFESNDGEAGVIERALGRMEELLSRPAKELSEAQEDEIFEKVPGILPRLKRQGDRAVL
jgi:trimethylamine--corrinoid protein Co-methyltransferase